MPNDLLENKPVFMIIGGEKCATTWSKKKLQQHPKISILTHEKNLDFKFYPYFTDLRGVIAENQLSLYKKRGINEYKQKLRQIKDNNIIGDSCTLYLYDESVPKILSQYFPNIKLLIFLRDPVKRTYSQYKGLPNRKQKIVTFEQAVKSQKRFINWSLYGKYIENYLEYFSKDQLIFCFFEDLKKDPLQFIQGIYNKLGVDDNFVPSDINKKENSRREKDMRALRSRLEKKYFFKNIMDLAKKLNLYEFCKRIIARVLPRETLSEVEKERLYKKFFKEDIERVEELTGRNLSHWKH